MSEFKNFASVVHAKLQAMEPTGLFMTSVDKDALYDLYLNSFPEGTNVMFRERTEHDCTCCKQFIRNIGGVVTIGEDGQVISIWEVDAEDEYKVVADALAAFVKSHAIVDVYYHDQKKVGEQNTKELKEGAAVRTWNHFYHVLDGKFVKAGDDIASAKGDIRDSVNVFKRSLEEISVTAIDTVLELIEQNLLYRGEQNLHIVKELKTFKTQFEALAEDAREGWCWKVGSAPNHNRLRYRGMSIGTLLVDLSEGRELEGAVKSFEDKVSGTNYKRPTALISPAMITNAQKKIEELGMTGSLVRRYAVQSDLTINNVLFADRDVKVAMNVFDELKDGVKTPTQSLDKVKEVSAEEFFRDVLPKAKTLEALFENGHTNNLFSLIAPQDASAPGMFSWGNNFSWSYNGELADSIKERVKAAGGNVDGFLRASLSWYNNDDLDLHMYEPGGNHIYFCNRTSFRTGGQLDIDMNGSNGMSPTRTPVENIFYTDESRMNEGEYKLVVHNYNKRERKDDGFVLELEYKGKAYQFAYDQSVGSDKSVAVVTFKYTKAKGVEIVKSIPHSETSREVWGIPTGVFRKVTMVMNSPNHWDGEQSGNKHYFFMLDKCNNPDDTRGFYNEYLKPELNEHRKVFEVLGGKIKAPHSNDQVSGLGFSSTQRNHLFVKVGGMFDHVLKIVF